MQFSNDGSRWTAPEPFTSSRTWTLPPGDGTKTCYVRYQDTPGNWSAATAISDSVVLDTAGPASILTLPAYSTDVSDGVAFPVNWSATDQLSGVATYEVAYRAWDSAAYAAWVTGVTATFAQFTGIPGQTYSFRVHAQDGAGNLGGWSAEGAVVVPFDDPVADVKGKWLTVAGSGQLYGGSAQYTTKKNASLTYNFTGARELSLIITGRADGGYADVYLGSKLVKTVSFFSPVTAYRQRVLVAACDTPTSGQLRVVARGTRPAGSAGTRIEVDGIAVKR
jgi:hypothetical protein